MDNNLTFSAIEAIVLSENYLRNLQKHKKEEIILNFLYRILNLQLLKNDSELIDQLNCIIEDLNNFLNH